MLDGLSKGEKLNYAVKLFTEARNVDREYQKEASEDFAFRDGEQYTRGEKAILEEECRPALVMNVCKSSIDLVMGINDDTRVKYKASPVDPTDGFLCEVINKITNWVDRNYSVDEEEDEAAESSAICGRGYIACDFEIDPKNLGHIRLINKMVPVHEIKVDPTSRSRDHSDAGYIFWDKWLTKSDFKVRFPKLAKHVESFIRQDSLLPPNMTELPEPDFQDSDYGTEESDYTREFDPDVFYDKSNKMIRLIHMEYWQPYFRYYAFNPVTKKREEVEKKDIPNLKKVFPVKFGRPFEYIKVMDRKVKWLQFIGDQIIYDDDSPIPYDGFGITPCYAYTDVSKRTRNHFGVIRLMKDPQREINKRWSQTLNLLNNQVQPGLIAEPGAFLDERQAEQSLKTPGDITYVQEGAIRDQKFMERNVPTFPNAPMQMEQFSEVILRKITGINPDLLGQDRGRQEPGVVIRLRQQQGLTLLKPLFNSIRGMRKGTFERRLAIILKYMPDEQILQILGQNGRFAIKNGVIIDKKIKRMAPMRDLRSLKYNVEAEEAPGNKSQRVLELSIYIEMMQAGMDVDPRVIISKLDLPEEERTGWINYISQKQKYAMMQAERQLKLAEMEAKGKLATDSKRIQSDYEIKQAKVVDQRKKDEEKQDIDKKRLFLEDVKSRRDTAVRNRQVDAQFYAAGKNNSGGSGKESG